MTSRLLRAGGDFGAGRAIGLLILGLLVGLRLWDPFPVEVARLRTFDAYQLLGPRVSERKLVVIVDIDEASLQSLGQWPWPRTVVADLVTRLRNAGALVIGFDVVFAEPDRLSPALFATRLDGLDAETREKLGKLPSTDSMLASAMRNSRVVLGLTALSTPSADAEDSPPIPGVGVRGPDPTRFLSTFPGLLRNIPVLENAAAGFGLFTILPERDGIVRRVPAIIAVKDTILPSLSVEVLRVISGGSSLLINSDEAGVKNIRLPGFEIPTDERGHVWLHFGRHDPGRFVSARKILEGNVAPEFFRNKIALVGTSAIGLLDLKTTPVDRAMPGVEVHAQMLESLIGHDTLSTLHGSVVIELLIAICTGLLIIGFAPLIGPLGLLGAGFVVALIIAGASWWEFAQSKILLDATFPLASSFTVYGALVFTNYFREQFDRRRIRSAFGQYLSPALVDELARYPEKLKLGGEERVMTILFSDVRGFTGVAEHYKHDPQGLTGLMNRFLTPLTDAILFHRGTIDKYMGDAVMAFWNAPLDDPDHQANACAAALDMQMRMKELNDERQREAVDAGQTYIHLDVGIGLNTGACVVGNMGSASRFDYSVLGDTVNLASRLEGLSATYGVRIILGSNTARAVSERFALLEIDLVRVKGKNDPECIYALLGGQDVRMDPAFAELAGSHAALIETYRRGHFARAREHLDSCGALGTQFGLDRLYALYADRIAENLAEPPPEGWTGVYVAKTK